MNPEFFFRHFKLINLYGPFLGAGIRVVEYNADFTFIKVRLTQRFYNNNMFGTHFGGSLYAMCDPFYVFIALRYLGNDYIVWDKSACIQFKKPGRKKVFVEFHIPVEKLEAMKQQVDTEGKADFEFETRVYNEENETIAEVKKVIYVRKKG